MQFYTKFQSPQNLFTNIRKIPRVYQHVMPNDGEIGEEWNQAGFSYNIINKDYDPTFMTIIAIINELSDNHGPMPQALKYLKKKSNTYLWISLIVHIVILLPLTLLVALTRDIINIILKPVVIVLNLALDAAQLAIEAVTLALQLVAFCIEKAIVNPIAFTFNKLFSKANNEEEGPKPEQPSPEEGEAAVPSPFANVAAKKQSFAKKAIDKLAKEQAAEMNEDEAPDNRNWLRRKIFG